MTTAHPQPTFSGHETFALRGGWLKKAFDLLADHPDLFGREDAFVLLGVGKNMATSIRFWGRVCGVFDRDTAGGYAPTAFGRALPEFLLSAPRPADGGLPIYRLPQLYAYVEATLGASLFGRARGRRWAEVAAMREHLPDLAPLAVDLLTTIGVLGALGQQRGLRAGLGQIGFALREDPRDGDVADTLSGLNHKRLIVYRKYRESYVLWEGSDLDLDGLLDAARQIMSDQTSLVSLLQQQAAPTPLIAHRHSYRNSP